jgi:hypothetical protein
VFLLSFEEEYRFLKKNQQVGKVLRFICKSQFSIEYGGRRSDILQHTKERKHGIAAESKSCSKKVTSHFTIETITDECKHTAAEGLFAFPTIKHNHSFRSMDCTSSAMRRCTRKSFQVVEQNVNPL